MLWQCFVQMLRFESVRMHTHECHTKMDMGHIALYKDRWLADTDTKVTHGGSNASRGIANPLTPCAHQLLRVLRV